MSFSAKFIYSFLLITLILGDYSIAHAQYIEKVECKIYFDSDIDQLNAEAENTIRKTILELNDHTIKEIYINGHADSDASDEYNVALSERRALNAKSYLRSIGVKNRMVKLQAFGESKPVSRLKSQNRRVDLVFVYEIFEDETVENHVVKRGKIDPNKRKVIQGYVYHAITKKPLPSQFVIEKNGRNNFKNTNKRAYFRLYEKGQNSLKLVFSKTGYLTETISVSKLKIQTTRDTLTLKIYLNPIKIKEKLSFDHIYFFTDSHILKPESKDDLEDLLNYMLKNEEAIIEIQGHMNFPANRYAAPMQIIYNRTLSHNRAKAIYLYLIKAGIAANRMTYKGMSNFAMKYPIPKTAAEEDANKRVEAWVLEKTVTASN